MWEWEKHLSQLYPTFAAILFRNFFLHSNRVKTILVGMKSESGKNVQSSVMDAGKLLCMTRSDILKLSIVTVAEIVQKEKTIGRRSEKRIAQSMLHTSWKVSAIV